jgi:hypothetical protein
MLRDFPELDALYATKPTGAAAAGGARAALNSLDTSKLAHAKFFLGWLDGEICKVSVPLFPCRDLFSLQHKPFILFRLQRNQPRLLARLSPATQVSKRLHSFRTQIVWQHPNKNSTTQSATRTA